LKVVRRGASSGCLESVEVLGEDGVGEDRIVGANLGF
jgi:hypothetical protein